MYHNGVVNILLIIILLGGQGNTISLVWVVVKHNISQIHTCTHTQHTTHTYTYTYTHTHNTHTHAHNTHTTHTNTHTQHTHNTHT